MTRRTYLFLLLIISLFVLVSGEQNHPYPTFDKSNYQFPQITTPLAKIPLWDWIDTGVLFAALCAASWLTLKKRNRKWIAGLMLFSLFYFGFWRQGCVCPVGSIGNIAFAATNSSYTVPVVVLVFFLMPLLFTLFFGRSFCGAVCPLGAIQDLFSIKPLRIPTALDKGLRIFPYVYLAAAILMAATGTMFLICRYDPFVTLFRFNGHGFAWILAISFLVVSIFIARPYCRFVCPYGVLLRNLSKLSKWPVAITQDECINCRLCEKACPYGAIATPVKELPALEYAKNKRRFIIFLLLGVVLAFAGGWLGWAVYPVIVESVGIPDSGQPKGMKLTIAFGILISIVITTKLISSLIVRPRKNYEASRADCMSCGRCFTYCPNETQKKELKADGVL